MKKFAVKTRFIFTGTFFIAAEDKEEARKLVDHSCGLVLGRTIHSSLSEEIADWDFPTHPDKTIVSVRRTKPEAHDDGYQF
jgi:hypothetical protein